MFYENIEALVNKSEVLEDHIQYLWCNFFQK